MKRGGVLLAAVVAAGLPAAAGAQARGSARPARLEVGGALTAIGAASMGRRDANETTAGGGAFRLFSTSTELGAAPAFEGRVGVRLTERAQINGSILYSSPQVRTTISNDVEASGQSVATERVKEIAVGADVLLFLRRFRPGRRAEPFVTAGAGYLRYLHEGATLVSTGRMLRAGGGVNVALVTRSRPRSRPRTLGLRVDARVLARTNGVAVDRATHVSPALGAGLFLAF